MSNNSYDKKIVGAIDIGSKNIICGIGMLDINKNKIKLLGISSLESNSIVKGSISNRYDLIEHLETVLSTAEQMASEKIENVTVSINGEHIRSINTQAAVALNGKTSDKIIEERRVESKDIKHVLNMAQAITLPSDMSILHTFAQEYIVDTVPDIDNPLGLLGRRLETKVHLVTASTTAVKNIIECVEELGVKVDNLVFKPLASSLAVLNDDEIKLGVTLVEIGFSNTTIAIFQGGSVQYSSVIPIGASSITKDIAVMMQISIEDAEKIKIKYGSAKASMSSEKLEVTIDNNGNNNDISKISEYELSEFIEARMQEIFNLIIGKINRAGIKDALNYGMVLCGGGAQLRNIIILAKETFKINARVGKISNADGIKDLADEPIHSTIIGMLLWKLKSKEYIINEDLSLLAYIKKTYESIKNSF